MPTRLCLEPGCHRKAEVRGRCREHASENRRYTRSVNDRFYSSLAWRMQRRQQLVDNPMCEYVEESGEQCGALADSVHHIRPLEDGGAPRDPDNLQSLCRAHHSMIHRRLGLDRR